MKSCCKCCLKNGAGLLVMVGQMAVMGLGMVLAGACSSEPPYVPAAERMEEELDNDGAENNGGQSGESGDNQGQGDNNQGDGQDDNQGDNQGDEAGEGAVTNGHGWVDLGLSVRWATANLDAANPGMDGNPMIPGSLFKWGAVLPVSSSEAPGSFPFVPDDSDIAGTVYDAATALWGAPWRMPTESELNELLSSCEISWELSGCRFTASNGESVFFPAAGYCDFLPDTSLYDFQYPSVRGCYRSSSASVCLTFERPSDGGQTVPLPVLSVLPRYVACSVRPVCPK